MPMDLRKRMIFKILILGAVSLIVLGYSIYRQKNAPDPVPEIESVKRLLRDSSKHNPEDYTAAWNRAESILMTRRKYDDVHRLNRIIRESGKLPKERTMLLDFSEYTAYLHARKYDEAMKALDSITALPKLAPEVKFAVLGEKMRVLAASKGIDKAMQLFRTFRKENPVPPKTSIMFCRTAALILMQYQKKEETYSLLANCASAFPENQRHHFLEQLGVLLVRQEKNPEQKRDSLIPINDFPAFFTVSMAMADEYAKRKNIAKAESILRSLAENPKTPQKFRKMALLKLNIMKEKRIK